MDVKIASASIAVIGTLGGALLGFWLQRETKRLSAMQRRIESYRREIRARQAQEDVACEWLVDLG